MLLVKNLRLMHLATSFAIQFLSIQATTHSTIDQLSSPLEIDTITFSSDIPLTSHEFFYLSGLQEQCFLTRDKLTKAIKNLNIKKRFSEITVDVTNASDNKKNLHVTLAAQWIFKKLEFEGIWFGKPHYTNLYLQQIGDVFNINLHEESLKNIRRSLHSRGYFDCIIKDEIFYSSSHKTIAVHIKIDQKKRYFIRNAHIDFIDTAKTKNKALVSLQKDILTKFQNTFSETYYSKKLLNKHIRKLARNLKALGYNAPSIKISKAYNNNRTVDITLKARCGKRKLLSLTGNTVLSDEYIANEFIGSDSPDWIFSPDIMAQQVLHEYYKKGYWHTSIKPSRLGPAHYHLDINEGQPTTIETVEIIDNKTKTKEASSAIMSDFLGHKTCDQGVLDESLDRLKQFYLSQGFWDFKIIDKRFEKNKFKKTHSVKILVEKGVRRFYNGFSIEACKELELHTFFKKYKNTSPHQPLPFNQQWLFEQQTYIFNHLQKQGYWYARVEPHLVVLPQQSEKKDLNKIIVFVRWKINPGAQVRFGKTILRGATTIDFERIKKQCAFDDGMVWSREKIDRTRKKLKSLDIFKTVQIQPYQLSKNKGTKPIIITIVDDEPVELRARAGYFVNSKNILFKSQETPKVGASFIIKNPTNRADLVALAGDWTKFERKFTIDYQQPSPFGVSPMGIFKGYANKYIHPVEIRNSGSAYQALQYGFLTGLTEQYKEHYRWNVNVGNEWLRITRVHGNLKFDTNLINKTLTYFFIEPCLEIDRLDDHANTTSGTLTNVNMKLMFPETAGEITAKCVFEQALFCSLHKKLVIAARARFGHIFGRKFEKILPTERFYLGGPYSVRGYEPDALPPLGVSERIENNITDKVYTIQGGSSMFNASIELRIAAYKSFGVVVFQDVGVLSQSGLIGLNTRWYPGSGFGLRYKTPIGSLRFDIGWKWKRRLREDTKSYAWYLTLGEAF